MALVPRADANEPITPHPQRKANRFWFGEKVLAWLGDGEVRRLDPLGLGVVDRLPFPGAQGLGGLRDGSVVVVVPGEKEPRVRELAVVAPGSREAKRYLGAGAVGALRPRVFAAARGDEVYVAQGRNRDVARVRFDAASGRLFPFAVLDVGDDEQQTLVGTGGDAVIYATSGEIVRAVPKQAARKWKNHAGWVNHVALGATEEDVWTTQGGRLALLSLAGAGAVAEVVAERELSKTPIVHLAGAGGAAAVVLVEGDRWSVALHDRGGERWRAPVATPRDLGEVYVAMSTTRVVVGGVSAMEGWDTATGRRVV
jgi:hypothetical protein